MNLLKNKRIITLLAVTAVALGVQSTWASETIEKVVPAPTVRNTKNPDMFDCKLEDLEVRITGKIVNSVEFETYLRSGKFGPQAISNSRVYDSKEGYTITLFHNETNDTYTKTLNKLYILKDKPLGIACACAEQGAYAMSKILGCERLIAPSYIAFDKQFEEGPNFAYSVQFIVEANISYQPLPLNMNGGKEEISRYKSNLFKDSLRGLSIEDRSHLFLIRFCLGSYDYNSDNVLFHKVKDNIKPIVIDFEDLATTKRDERFKNYVKSVCKMNESFSRTVVDLYKTLSIDQLKLAFQEGIKYAPNVYNDDFFSNIIEWKNELLEYIEQETKVV